MFTNHINLLVPSVQVTDVERPEWTKIFETAAGFCQEIEKQLPYYLFFFKRPDETKTVLTFVSLLIDFKN